ncbi:hypothetical protein [uncultured Thiothrix sp.]|uniref:hypothetical protein n=1 Tax=uncultured Thiothrix sp. TaxID=223185 RepID=UPI0026105829|nr:hypothetical protein [uncultured Thiothrix sp.]HMT92836.1 hypothetical protein [Thiolinea sp.]
MESVLHKRYKIGERLFSNALGELFLGRELQAGGNQRLLIHYLPAQLISDYALKQSLNHLQDLGSKAEAAVLNVLDCAWSDTEVCFVLEAPEAWSLSVLPALQGQPTNLHQKALSITQQLIDQGLITKGIDPALFLVAPNGDLHLMGTAFLTELQALEQQSPSLLQPQSEVPPKKKTRFLPLALLGSMGLVVAAGSLGLYQFAAPRRTVQAPTPPAITVSTLDKPSTHITNITSLVAAVEPKITIPKTDTSLTKVADKQLVQKVEEANLSLPTEDAKPSTATISASLLVTNSPVAIQVPPKPELPTNPQALKHLERAQEAVQRGHLQTGLYYLRLAKKLAADSTQLQTAARQLLEQAQLMGTTSEAISPQMQMDIQQEFGLN